MSMENGAEMTRHFWKNLWVKILRTLCTKVDFQLPKSHAHVRQESQDNEIDQTSFTRKQSKD